MEEVVDIIITAEGMEEVVTAVAAEGMEVEVINDFINFNTNKV